MSDPVLFVGTYEIPPGGVDAFLSQVAVMNEMIRDREPRVAFLGHYVNEDETEGTSIHLHPDAESFDVHMATAAAAIDRGTRTVRVTRIDFYGEPSEAVLARLSEAFDVHVKRWAGGVVRIEWP